MHLSSKKLIHGNTETFAENIPKCHFNSGKCAHKHRAAAPIRVSVYIVIMLFYLSRILSDKIAFYMLNSSYKRFFLVFKRSLTNSVYSLVGIDLDKHPVCTKAVNYKCFYIGNLHKLLSFTVFT